MLESIVTGIVAFITSLAILFAVALIGALPTYLLWNWIMPTVFGIKAITLFQAWGVIILSWILFKRHG